MRQYAIICPESALLSEINDIYFDNIQVLNGDIPVSMIRGYQTPTEEVRVHDAHFDNITFMGNKCETWQDMRLVTELANDIYVNGVRTCRQMKLSGKKVFMKSEGFIPESMTGMCGDLALRILRR